MKIKKITIIFILLLCMIIGAFLRLYRIADVPAGLLQDEAAAGYDAYSLIKTGRDHHGVNWPITFQTFNDWTGRSFNYQLIPFVKLFGLNTFSIRFTAAFFSILSILLVYLLGKELTGGEIISLLMAFLYSFSQFSVSTSRWAVQPNTVVFFFLPPLILFLKGLNKGKKRRIYWSICGLLFGHSLYTYPSMIGFVPLFLLGSSIIIINKIKKEKGIFKDLLVLILMFLISSLPLVIDLIRRPEMITTKLAMVSVATRSTSPVIAYIGNYISYYLPGYLFLPGEVNPTRSIPGYGYENISLGLFYYLGIFILIFKKKYLKEKYPYLSQSKIFLLYWFLLIFPAPPSLTVPAGDFQRAIYIMPVMFFFISLGIFASFDVVKKLSSKSAYNIAALAAVAAISIYAYSSYSFYRNYFGAEYRGFAQWYFQYGLEDVIKFTSANESKYQQIIIDNTINQPYIYVLFYKGVDPATLNYQDFADVDSQTSWLSVKRYKTYLFKKVTGSEIDGSKLVKTIYNSPYSNYAIYEKENDLIVKFEVLNK